MRGGFNWDGTYRAGIHKFLERKQLEELQKQDPQWKEDLQPARRSNRGADRETSSNAATAVRLNYYFCIN